MKMQPRMMAGFRPKLSATYGVMKKDTMEPMLNMLTRMASLLSRMASLRAGFSLSSGKKNQFQASICCDVLTSMLS